MSDDEDDDREREDDPGLHKEEQRVATGGEGGDVPAARKQEADAGEGGVA